MIIVYPAVERGRTKLGWLDSRHTFSFGDYFDPDRSGFRVLRVINEDRVQPGMGFPLHSHRDMEILTYVLAGTIEHRDSLGNVAVVRAGELQRMSAGTGVRHSEYNPSSTEPLHFLQIWLLPDRPALPPSYEQRAFDLAAHRGRLVRLAGGGPGALTVHQDALLYGARLEAGDRVEHTFTPARHGWVQVARGGIELNHLALRPGDGAAVTGEGSLVIRASTPAEALVFDLP